MDNVPDSPMLDIFAQLTIEAWVSPADILMEDQVILSKSALGGYALVLNHSAVAVNGQFCLLIYNTATGHCQSCLADDPLFLDPEGGGYGLQESSTAVDHGVLIPGVNDDFAGEGPDIGAYELGGDGPDADIDSDADSDADTDTDTDADADSDGDGYHPPPEEEGGPSGNCGCDHTGAQGHGLAGLILSALI